jgi:hypothetical protein
VKLPCNLHAVPPYAFKVRTETTFTVTLTYTSVS